MSKEKTLKGVLEYNVMCNIQVVEISKQEFKENEPKFWFNSCGRIFRINVGSNEVVSEIKQLIKVKLKD